MGHICYYGKELEIFDEERPKAGQASSSFVFTAGWVKQIGLSIIASRARPSQVSFLTKAGQRKLVHAYM